MFKYFLFLHLVFILLRGTNLLVLGLTVINKEKAVPFRRLWSLSALKNNLLYQIKQKRLSHAGHCIVLRNVCNFWLPQSVRCTCDCSLQSAGEAQSGVAGHQSITHHKRTGLWRKKLSSSFRATYRHYGERDQTYEESTKRLYTSPPVHTTVWSLVNVYFNAFSFTEDKII